MNTTNKPPEWGKWGDGKKEPNIIETRVIVEI